MLTELVLNTIELYYPKGVSETYDNEKYHSSEQIRQHKAVLQAAYNYHPQWQGLKSELKVAAINFFDYSTIPSYNSCFHLQVRKNDHLIILLVSPFFNCYNFLIVNVADKYFIEWGDFPENVLKTYQSIKDVVEANYEGYVSLPRDLLCMKVPDFSVQPFEQGEAKVFNYLYTLLTQFDKLLCL
jgi:hypothetical protein